MTQQEKDELMYASEEDIAFYHKCVEGLPTLAGLNGTGKDADGVDLPYGCGPHSVRCLREIVEIVKPKRIFEIGFNMGWSASMWLELSKGHLLSCDISHKKETFVAATYLKNKWGNHFEYTNRNNLNEFREDSKRESRNLGYYSYEYYTSFDLIFIDGSHLLKDVLDDIKFALLLQIPYLVFDDILPQFGPGVMPAIKEYPQLEPVKEMGNIALYKNTTV